VKKAVATKKKKEKNEVCSLFDGNDEIKDWEEIKEVKEESNAFLNTAAIKSDTVQCVKWQNMCRADHSFPLGP
jgi:hypothetical protein